MVQQSNNKTTIYIDQHQLLWFIINRPERRNAIDYDVMNSLKDAIEQVKENNQIRGFVITGSGDKAFCSGGDLSVFHQLKTKDESYSMLSKMGTILYEVMTLPVPTFALLNGTAVGGGCEIASACDFRIALNENVKVGFIQGNLGITTGWGGANMLMERLSSSNAMEMLYSGRLFQLNEAKNRGFINDTVSSKSHDQLSEYISQQLVALPSVLRAYKKVFIEKWIQSNLKERMLLEIDNCSILWEKDEHHEAVDKFLRK